MRKDFLSNSNNFQQTENEVSDKVKRHFRELQDIEESKLLHFIGLTEIDIENLHKINNIFQANVGEIVDAFYGKISTIPKLMDIINRHSTIERLKQTLERYLLDMTSGEIGKDYVIRRKVIGNVHNRINLFPEWYLGAYSLIQNTVSHILFRECHFDVAQRTFQSFLKLSSFDMQIVINTYIEDYTSSMMRLNEIEELQHRLSQSSETLAANAEQTTSSISDKDEQVQLMVEEIDEMVETFNAMIEHVDNGKKNVELALLEVENIVQTIETTSELTTELAQSSERIGEVIKVIRDISNQTNVLSLNASIESARAGVHGQGFSVVAKEVRKLSQQTRESIERIQDQITTVQNKVHVFENSFAKIVEQTSVFKKLNEQIIQVLDESVLEVKKNDSKVKKLSDFINDFRKTFREISEASENISNMAVELSYLNQELSDKF